jgi:transposase
LELKICPDCGRKVKKKKGKRKRTTTDIQPGKPINTEWDIERGYCENCKKIVEPVVAEALPNSRFGLTLALYVTFLSVLGITLGKIRCILLHDYNLTISKGTLANLIEQVAGYLGSDYEKLRLQLLQEKDIFGDETSHPINGKNAWLWTFIGKTVSYLTVQKSRGQKVVKKILAGYNGILHSDFWSAYNAVKCDKQKCLAHLKRHLHFVKNKETSPELKKYATNLLRLLRYAVHENRHTPAFRAFCEKRLHAIIDREYADKDCRRLNKTLRRHASEIFLFTEKETETTTNTAERSLRPMVIKRKNTHGSYSIEGAQAHAVMASFYQTSQLQDLEYEPYIKELIQKQLQNRTET